MLVITDTNFTAITMNKMTRFFDLQAMRLMFGGVIASLVLFSTVNAVADDNVGIGTASPDTSAVLDLTSANKGFLTPRLTTVQRNAIVLPANGLLIFNTSNNRFEFNSGTPLSPNWSPVVSTNGWNLNGNSGLNPATNFFGTTDANPIVFKTNNNEQIRIMPNGNVGIGTSNPGSKLHVAGGNVIVDTVSANNAGQIIFYNPARTNTTSFKAGAQTANINYTFPLAGPSNGQFLSSDVNGNLSWQTVKQLPDGGTTINSTLIWNGTTWVTNPFITYNNSTINLGDTTHAGSIKFYDGNGQYVNINVQDLTQNRTYILPEVGDTAYFVMTKGTQIIGGNKSFTNNVSILGGSDLRWFEPTLSGNNFISFKAPALANDITYTWPATGGTNGQVLSTDGSGNLNWITQQTGVTGTGTNGQIAIWNGANSLTSSTGFFYNTTNNFLGLGTTNPGAKVDIQNGNLFVTNNNNQAGEIRWYEPSTSGNNYTSFRAQSQATNITYTFPATSGNPGQMLTLGTGDTLTWTNTTNFAWGLNGNAGTNPNTPNSNFLGTSDNQPLAIRTNNTERMRILANGGVVVRGNSNPYGLMQVNDNTAGAVGSAADGYSGFAVISSGVVTGDSSTSRAFTASKQSNSVTNIGGYFIASNGTNNYGIVAANGDVFLGQVDTLTPGELKRSLTQGNANKTYVHQLRMSGPLVTSVAGNSNGAGNPGQVLISQGPSAAPQWTNPASVFNGAIWSQGGNTQTTEQTLGTSNNFALPIITNNVERMRVTADGKVGIGTNSPSNSAQTEIFSTSKGFLMPRMTNTQRDAITTPAEGLMVYVTTSTEEGFWYFDGTKWMPLTSTISANSTVVVRRKVTDEVVASSTTLQDDDDLFLALAANQIWEVEGTVEFGSASATPDANFSFIAPAGSSFKMTYHSNDGSPSTFTSGTNDGTSASTVQIGGGQSSVVHVKGLVVVGANSGDFRLRWSQNTADANTTAAKANSYLKFTRIQ